MSKRINSTASSIHTNNLQNFSNDNRRDSSHNVSRSYTRQLDFAASNKGWSNILLKVKKVLTEMIDFIGVVFE